MPRREDIERFTEVLNSLGDEPAIRAARSESIEDASPPGEQVEADQGEPLDSLPSDDDLSSFGLGDLGDTQPAGAEPEPEPGTAEDFFEGLTGLPEETAAPAPEEPEQAETPAPPAEGADEGIDFSSLFADETGPQPIEDLDTGATVPMADSDAPSEPAAPAAEEQFDFPEGEPENLQADLSQMEILPDDLGATPPAPAEETPTETGADFGSFEDLGAFPLEAPEAPGTDEAVPSEPTETPVQGLELPSIDDLTFGEPSATAPTGAAEQSPEPFAPGTQPEDEFQTPSFEGLDLDTATGFEEPQPTGFEEPQPGAFEESPSGDISAEEPAPQMESLGEESLGDLNLDDFSLPESAEQFGAPEAAPAAPPPRPTPARPAPARPAAPRPAARTARPAPARSEAPTEELQGAEGEIALTPEQFASLKRTLESLPRNLKIAVQDLVGEGAVSGPNLPKLISLLVSGASAQEIATLVGKITGKRIRVPPGYEKKTGVAFEAERRTFGYALRENIFPLVRVLVLTALAGGILAFFGYRFVYRPLSAYANYRAGYYQISNDRFTLANERFDRAVSAWPVKSWFFRFAEGFAARRQYVLAEEKYDQLLARYHDDRKAILDYAGMESTKVADYEKADRLLRRILDVKMYDYDALLASGDNLIRWAERDSEKYKAARLTYATLIERYGPRDDLLFRMLRYFIRTENGDEVERLRAYYASRPDVKVDPEVYAELGGYLVEHRRLDYVQDVLFRAEKVRPGLPEVHYNLARYYRAVGSLSDEKKALDHVLRLLTDNDALTHRRLTIEIDTHTRLGEYFYRTKEYLAAGRELQKAISLVEQNQRMKLIGQENIFGRPSADLGDLAYYVQGDLATAATAYQVAIANNYTGPELTYKIGYIQYVGRDFKSALGSLSSAEDASSYPSEIEPLAATTLGGAVTTPADAPAAPRGTSAAARQPGGRVPVNLLFALGNCFYQRGDYFAAQGYYLQAKDRLETRRAAAGTLLPEVKPEDRELLQYLVKVYNNLGVTMLRISERMGDRKARSEGLVTLTNATEIADSLAKFTVSPEREADPSRRNETRSIPSLNMRGILYPLRAKYDLQIYQPIAKDFEASSW
jgi:tetratricopeptide (TPR) repeat protein